MFSAANDTLLPVRSRRGRDDRAAGEKKLHVGDAAGRPNNADRARAGRLAIGHSSSHTKDANRTRGGAQTASTAPVRKRSKRSNEHLGMADLRAVHDVRGPRSEKGPFMARSSRGVSPNARLRGFSDAWREYLAKASSFWIHGGDMLPRTGVFPVRGPFGNA